MNITRQLMVFAGGCSLLAAVAGGCDDRNSVRVYQAPKETAMPASIGPATAASVSSAPVVGATKPGEPQWVVPEGWKQLPAQQMRFATFQIDPADPKLNVVVYTFGPESGAVLPNVNRWEQQIGATPTQPADLAKVVTHLQNNGMEIDAVDIKGPAPAGQAEGVRMLAAIMPANNQVWFLKFVGPASKVETHKAEYESFLKSITFVGSAADVHAVPAVGNATAPAEVPANPRAGMGAIPTIPAFKAYTTPQGWTLDPQERPMRVATFHIAGDGPAVDMIISKLPANQFGTPEANINRWRGQVGLAPVADPNSVERPKITVDGAEGFIVDFAGVEADGKPAQRLTVAQVTKGDSTYFFKLVGPSKQVEQQRKAFDSFLQSIQFSAE